VCGRKTQVESGGPDARTEVRRAAPGHGKPDGVGGQRFGATERDAAPVGAALRRGSADDYERLGYPRLGARDSPYPFSSAFRHFGRSIFGSAIQRCTLESGLDDHKIGASMGKKAGARTAYQVIWYE
jgi:hypothetical protein